MNMFFFTALSFFFSFFCIYGSCESIGSMKDVPIPSYTTSYYTQQLDNFNSNDERTFNQRILTASQYWKKDVLLFYPGNEAPIDEFYNNTGFLFELAERFQALVVFAEHRYYGETLPFGSQDTFTPANMVYLSVGQAMADFATLVQDIRNKMKIKKVIVLGGSYGGILAALLRYQYPSVFDGALAASAPMYMTAGLTESTAFFQKVTQDFADADSECPDVVRGAYADIIKNANDGNFQFITDSMRLCNTLTEDKVEHLQGWARDAFTTMAMVDYPYPASFLGELPAYPVNIAAGLLTSSTTTNRMTKLADAVGLLYNSSKTLPCFDIMNEYNECSDATGCGTGNEALAWDYQVCSEVMLNTTTNNVTDMFPVSTFNVKQHCQDKWDVTEKTTRINWPGFIQWVQSEDPNVKIIFSNGDLDPWSVGGVNNGGGGVATLLIKGGAHHLDLRSSNPRDPPSVVVVRNTESNLIESWITLRRYM